VGGNRWYDVGSNELVSMPPPDCFRDTDPRSREVFLALQRQMPRGRKALLVLELSEMLLQLSEQRVRQLHPEASEREVFLRMASRHLDRQTMIRAFGWDPMSHEPAGHQGRP